MSEALQKLFEHGTKWVRADFHLHTRADKEFRYDGDADRFVASYVEALEANGTRLAVITNHNKFDLEEFKALRKRARKFGIGVLPAWNYPSRTAQTAFTHSWYFPKLGWPMVRITSTNFLA